MKRALQLASVASMIDQFTIPSIKILQGLGYEVDVVADFTNPGTITNERCSDLKNRLKVMGVRVHDIAIPRSLDVKAIISSYKQVKKLINSEDYSLIHCHSPIGGVIARAAAKRKRRKGLRVIYTAHGFHFYSGAPIKNWIVFYPIEKYYSRFTDILITITKEDYKRASKRLCAKKTVYVPGIGIDTDKFKGNKEGRQRIREELQLDDSRVMLLSVGELNENKNHEAVIKAIRDKEITYVIVGKGHLREKLNHLAMDTGVDLRLPGFRDDVVDFYSAADIFILPSFREGLNVSLMEAMASGLACTCSRIRGNVDLINAPLFSPTNLSEISSSIDETLSKRDELSSINMDKICDFTSSNVNELLTEIYRECAK